MQVVSNIAGGLHLLDAPDGKGKTLVISLISATTRSAQKIALPLASSRIAAILLEGVLKLSLNVLVTENPTSNISRNYGKTSAVNEIYFMGRVYNGEQNITSSI